MIDTQSDELSLSSWVIPSEKVVYLANHLLYIEIQNNSNKDVYVKTVTCSFQTEKNLKKHKITYSQPFCLQSKNRKSISMPLEISLDLTQYTNIPTLKVTYTTEHSTDAKETKFEGRAIIVYNIPYNERYFFISHKIPKDTRLAKSLDHYLQKVGFRGYVAEAEPQPGNAVWDENIFPSIDNSIGVIAVYTVAAKESSANLDREIRHAKAKDKKIIFLIEESIDNVPIDQSREYILTDASIKESDLVEMIDKIRVMYDKGIFD